MRAENKKYFSLGKWIVALVIIGLIIGSITQAEVATWYITLNRSPLTPPNYVFPIAWTILYIIIATCGWIIWHTPQFPKIQPIKILYLIQLILNWSWTPLFFYYHLIGLGLSCLLLINAIILIIIYLCYPKIKKVSLWMIPYLLWLLFAMHLNYYIWQYN